MTESTYAAARVTRALTGVNGTRPVTFSLVRYFASDVTREIDLNIRDRDSIADLTLRRLFQSGEITVADFNRAQYYI